MLYTAQRSAPDGHVVHTSRPIDPIVLWASAIDVSNFVATVVPAIRSCVAPTGSVLDVGAGGGQLGAALAGRSPWTAIEPCPRMRRRLRALIDTSWESATPDVHRTVLAANLPFRSGDAERFLERCRAWSSAAIVWIVPVIGGPRSVLLPGCLPAEWRHDAGHAATDAELTTLVRELAPRQIVYADWTLTLRVPAIEPLARYIGTEFNWTRPDRRRRLLVEYLLARATTIAGGVQFDIPQRSAIAIWPTRG